MSTFEEHAALYQTPELRDAWAEKHWNRRHLLFSRFDEGIQIPDAAGWFDVTVEETAVAQAQRFKGISTVVDAFGGCGGNSIQLALVVDKVIYIEYDPKRLAAAKNNARVYGVDHKIEFHLGSFLDYAPKLKADAVYIAPPWTVGSDMEDYLRELRAYDLDKMPYSGALLFYAARLISDRIAFYIPPFTRLDQLKALLKDGQAFDLENHEYTFELTKSCSSTAYYGTFAKEPPFELSPAEGAVATIPTTASAALSEPWIKKHWDSRQLIFSKFDDGVQTPQEAGWLELKVEEIAASEARRFKNCKTVVDAFGGYGGNSIQLALVVDKVIYCEADEKVLESAKVNARVYGVEDKIEFKLGSFIDLAPELKADGIYLAPPWTLDSETKNYAVDLKNFDLEKLSPVAGKALFAAARLVSNNIAFYISPFARYSQLLSLGEGDEAFDRVNHPFLLEPGMSWLTASSTIYYGNLPSK